MLFNISHAPCLSGSHNWQMLRSILWELTESTVIGLVQRRMSLLIARWFSTCFATQPGRRFYRLRGNVLSSSMVGKLASPGLQQPHSHRLPSFSSSWGFSTSQGAWFFPALSGNPEDQGRHPVNPTCKDYSFFSGRQIFFQNRFSFYIPSFI